MADATAVPAAEHITVMEAKAATEAATAVKVLFELFGELEDRGL